MNFFTPERNTPDFVEMGEENPPDEPNNWEQIIFNFNGNYRIITLDVDEDTVNKLWKLGLIDRQNTMSGEKFLELVSMVDEWFLSQPEDYECPYCHVKDMSKHNQCPKCGYRKE